MRGRDHVKVNAKIKSAGSNGRSNNQHVDLNQFKPQMVGSRLILSTWW